MLAGAKRCLAPFIALCILRRVRILAPLQRASALAHRRRVTTIAKRRVRNYQQKRRRALRGRTPIAQQRRRYMVNYTFGANASVDGADSRGDI